ncbi:MAG TPA: DUF2207 domain-containing protein [Patescibacteria group bacterium]|nr:DUF2207 domain-containing protein [Patescibacteria group bacterium]
MKRGIMLMLSVVVLTVVGGASHAYADVNDFRVTSFTADDTLTRADAQGELHIVEHIAVDFTDSNHGLLRAIPDKYKNHRLQLHVNRVDSTTGAPVKYTKYTQNGNTVLKIGDPTRTVTGNQEYTIDYTVHNVMTFYGDHDELYWDINGDQWNQPFGTVRVMLHLPGDLRLSDQRPICYTGSFGSQARSCFVERPNSRTIISQTTAVLGVNETLSLVAGFQKGYFRPSTWYDTLDEYRDAAIAFAVPFFVLGGTAALFWFRHGRDPKGRGTIIPEYDAPDSLSPIEVGTVIDFKTDNKDITATIIDLAIRRYITIVEQKKDRALRKALTVYTLRLTNPDFSKLSEFETVIMTHLFTNPTAGQEVDLSYMKYKLASVATQLRQQLRKSLLDRDYFGASMFTMRRALSAMGILIALLLLAGMSSAFGSLTAWWVGATAGLIVAGLFLSQCGRRTEKGVAANDHIKGLKMYLQVAEAERIKMLQSPNAPYAAKATGPTRTVELFEKLLPYAMVLGVEQQWAKQFEDIYRTPPDWYSGNWNTFSVLYFTSSLTSGIGNSVDTAFASPSSSSSSGFGGGAGGGGGGGGGGGW